MRCIFAFFVAIYGMAQVESGNFSISGTVLNSVTGEPVKNALVSMVRTGDLDSTPGSRLRRGMMGASQRAMSGPGGEFTVVGLPGGRYVVSVEKPGFVQDNSQKGFEQRVTRLADSVANLRLKLSPLGVIEGQVLDQYGEPARGVTVRALLSNIQFGTRQIQVSRTVTTDDRGVYRLWNLQPGKYYVKAAGRTGGTYRFVGDGKPFVANSWEAFAPVYSNGARELASAVPVVILPGTQAGGDFKIELQPAFQIRGVLSGISGPGAVNFELLEGDEVASPSRVFLNSGTNRFEIHDVTSGSYLLRVSQGSMRAETPVTVKGRDLDGIALDLASGVEVKAIIHVPPPTPIPDDVSPEHPDLDAIRATMPVSCQPSLDATRGSDPSVSFNVKPPGEWSAENVFPGLYRVRAHCFGGSVISAFSGSTDLLTNPVIAIQPGVAPPPIEIFAAASRGTIHVSFEVEALPQTAGVLLVPSSGRLSEPAMEQVPQQLQDASGIDFPFLAPGDYSLYLVRERDEIPFGDPEFLKSLSGGVSVHLDNQEQKNVVLRSFAK